MLDLRGPKRILQVTLPDGTVDEITVAEISMGTLIGLQKVQSEVSELQKDNSPEASSTVLVRIHDIWKTLAPGYDFSKIPVSRSQEFTQALMETASKDLLTAQEKKTPQRKRGRPPRSSKRASA